MSNVDSCPLATGTPNGTQPTEKLPQPTQERRLDTSESEPEYPYSGAGRPRTKEKIVSFKFTSQTIIFLDSLPKGSRTNFIEQLIWASKEFKQWRKDRVL